MSYCRTMSDVAIVQWQQDRIYPAPQPSKAWEEEQRLREIQRKNKIKEEIVYLKLHPIAPHLERRFGETTAERIAKLERNL